jgi:PAS domain S-box-containing protein
MLVRAWLFAPSGAGALGPKDGAVDISVLFGAMGTISQGVLITGPDRRLVFVNRAFLDLTGYEESEVLGQTCAFLQGPGTDREMIRTISAALAENREFSGEILNYRKSGEVWWNDLTITPVFGEDGTLSHFIGVTKNISESKLAQQRLSKLEADYRTILENVQTGIVVHGAETEIVYANPTACKLLRTDFDTLAGKRNIAPDWSFIEESGAPLAFEDYPVNRVLRTGEIVRGMVMGADLGDAGEMVWLLCDAFPLKDEGGAVREVLSSFSEISALLSAKAEANLHRQRFELAGRATRDIIFDWDLETGEFWANEAYEEVFGRPPPDQLFWGENRELNVASDDRPMMYETMHRAVVSGEDRYRLEYGFQRPDGSRGTALVRAYILRDEDGAAKRIIGNTSDISERLQTLAALAESEERFRVIADSVSDVLWDHDFEANRWWISDNWPAKLGIELAGVEITAEYWFAQVDADDRARLNRSFMDALKSQDDRWEIEYRMVGDDGEKIDVLVRGAIFRRSDGRVLRMLGNVRNVTAEKKRSEGYTRARALEAVGQLTGGIAHDFNNQLLIIEGNAESLQETDLDEEQRDLVDLIARASRSSGLLTQRLLSFARQSDLGARRVKLKEVLSGTLALLQSGLPESISLDLKTPLSLWDVQADPNALEQAIVNLAVNARDAMPHGGRIVISCENKVVPEEREPYMPELVSGNYVVIAVTDNGMGMSQDVRSKIFEPFFTTKETGKGTGLGLSTVYGFAKQSGGHVSVYSEEGKGTTINLFLPKHQSKEGDPAPGDKPGTKGRGRGERILVVEDEPLVRIHVERLLRRMGYEVVSAANGADALTIFDRGDGFDLIFTDVIMPGGMNGQQLAERIQRRSPGIAVLFTSGYPAYAFESLGLEEQEGLKLLRKPYRRADLQEAVEAALAVRRGKPG